MGGDSKVERGVRVHIRYASGVKATTLVWAEGVTDEGVDPLLGLDGLFCTWIRSQRPGLMWGLVLYIGADGRQDLRYLK